MNAKDINDPLFPLQWHLVNNGQNGGTPGIDLNVAKVWEEYSGSGVVVAVVDQGVDFFQPDLAANLNTVYSASFPDGGEPLTEDDNHGTAVAGLIAAAADNGVGGLGVAPGSTLLAAYLNLHEDADLSGGNYDGFVAALNAAASSQIDVLNNSWGNSGSFFNYAADGDQLYLQGLEDAASKGRDGKGAIIIFAAGNDREKGFDSNSDYLTNSPLTISVAAIDNNGKVSSYSTPGACNLVAAPSDSVYYTTEIQYVADGDDPDSEPDAVEVTVPHDYGAMVTTDRSGELGYNKALSPQGDDCYDFGGTSAAAPEVAGVVALMLEANPDLGYRDVQEILALTARDTDSGATWTINGAGNWNGGGMRVNRDVGYGLVDALAAVRLAETWATPTDQKTAANLLTLSGQASPNAAIPDGQDAASSSVAMPAGELVERAVVTLDIDHPDASELVISLISPSGTKSVIYDSEGVSDPIPQNFMMSSTHFLGEASKGTWTLTVADEKGNGVSGDLVSWSLTLYGSGDNGDDRYVYTNEYAAYAVADPARTVIRDVAGTDLLNASAVSSNSFLNLGAGTFSLIDGAAVCVDPSTVLETAYGGDGNDVIWGNGADNLLSGGRGNDALYGGDGVDYIEGGDGFDVAILDKPLAFYDVSLKDDALVLTDYQGQMTLTNISLLAFADLAVTSESLAGRVTDNAPLAAIAL